MAPAMCPNRWAGALYQIKLADGGEAKGGKPRLFFLRSLAGLLFQPQNPFLRPNPLLCEFQVRVEDNTIHRLTVRSLNTQEMAKWWVYIAFDIEEPVYVIQSTGGRYRFVVGLVKDKIFILDELVALPGKG